MKPSTRLSVALVTGLLLSQTGYTTSTNTMYIGHICIDIAHQLNRIAESYHNELCSGDIQIASAYIGAAGNDLLSGKNEQALKSISYGKHVLKEINTTRAYCTQLLPEIKPYFARTITLENEIEILGIQTP